MEETIAGLVIAPIVVGILFLGLPWLVFHYITKWKQAGSLTKEDENLLDEMHDLARRLDERVCTIERIMDAEQPGWRVGCSPEQPAITGRNSRIMEARR